MTTPNEQLYIHASSFIGVKEILGDDNNPEIMEFFRSSGHTWVNSEETPWCSAAMNAWCREMGMPSTGSLRARSWLDVKSNDKYRVVTINSIEDLLLGDLLILWRGKRNGSQGHITLNASLHGGRLNALGGNQSNKVCVKAYPKYRFLSGRRFVEGG